MSEQLKRIALKYVRDKAKSRYSKGNSCEICAATEELEFHHYYSMAFMLENYIKQNGLTVDTIEDIESIREEFIAVHSKEVFDEAVTLCSTHHKRLHQVYGSKPALSTAEKQKRWVAIQRDKLN